jgi:hypothetical protein
MRTKTLLLTAALSAAGVATSMAQVFSVNAVGYVTVKVPANGFAMVANPLDAGAGNNTVGKLFSNVPPGTQIFIYDNATGSYEIGAFDDLDNAIVPPAAANKVVEPGNGVFVKNNSAQEISITFVGEVKQGTLSNPLPKGFSIKASQVPQVGTAKELGLPGVPGDQVFQFNATTQTYDISGFDDLDNDWVPALKPLAVGQAFFLSRGAAGSWDRTFNVNQ